MHIYIYIYDTHFHLCRTDPTKFPQYNMLSTPPTTISFFLPPSSLPHPPPISRSLALSLFTHQPQSPPISLIPADFTADLVMVLIIDALEHDREPEAGGLSCPPPSSLPSPSNPPAPLFSLSLSLSLYLSAPIMKCRVLRIYLPLPHPTSAINDPLGNPTNMHTCIHICIHTCIHTYMHTYIHTCMHACIHRYVHTYTYIHIDMYSDQE